MTTQLTNIIASVFGAVSGFLNSSFLVAFVGGLTGAVGGALGAQHIVERSKLRDELVKELRNTNAAIMVGFSIVNAALALKNQHVHPMCEKFFQDKAALETFKAQRAAGQVPKDTQYPFVADLRSFPAPNIPIETLKTLLFEKISSHGRPLALASVIEQSLVGLTTAILRRDSFAERMLSGAIPSGQVPYYYFGLPLPNGTNQEYPDLVKVISSYLDDLAYFTALLCQDLTVHGELIREAFTKKFRKDAPKVTTVDFSGPRKTGLIPPDTEYGDWLKAFAGSGSKEAVAQ